MKATLSKQTLSQPIEDYLSQSFPWHRDAYQHFIHYQIKGLMPSGLIIDGQKGVGKTDFAKLIAKSLLCSNQKLHHPSACLNCSDCQLVDQGTHPSLIQIGLEEGSKQIKLHANPSSTQAIPQIEDLIQLLIYSESKAKVAIINPADAINLSAANALLKTLEELGANKHLLFITHQFHRLPATIISRSQRISLKVIKSEALDQWWLNQTHLKMADDGDKAQIRSRAISQFHHLLSLNNHSVYGALEFREKINLVLDFWKYLEKLWHEKISPHQMANLISSWDKDFIVLAFLALIQIGLYQNAQNKLKADQNEIELIAASLFPFESKESFSWFFSLIEGFKSIPFEVLIRFYQDIEKVGRMLQTPANQNLLFENLLVIFYYLNRIDRLEKYPDSFNYQQYSIKK